MMNQMNYEQRRMIGGYMYVAQLNDNNFSFFVDPVHSAKVMKTKKDPFEKFDGGPTPLNYDRNDIANRVWEAKQFVEEFVSCLTEKLKLDFFRMATSDKRKLRIYKAFGKRLANKYGYYMEPAGYEIRFYKIKS